MYMSYFFELLTENTTIQADYTEKITALKKVEQSFPIVIIIHCIHDSTVVYMSEKGLKSLGLTLEDVIALKQDYYARFFNAEDAKDYVPKILGLLERNNDDESVSFFQQVRSPLDDDWKWFLSATSIFMRDENNKPLLTITTATPVDAQHHIATKAERLLQENNFLRHNYHTFEQLTQREKEVLKMMALGLSASEIAAQLYISEKTAATHRRNIKNKLKAKNNYDIARFAQAFDLI